MASNVIFIQNIYWFQPSELETAIDAYFELILPTYRIAGVELTGLFGTILGSGSMNGRALRQVELIRFDDLNVWNTYRNILKNDARFQRESRERWLSKIDKVSSVIMEPTDFSRLRRERFGKSKVSTPYTPPPAEKRRRLYRGSNGHEDIWAAKFTFCYVLIVFATKKSSRVYTRNLIKK